MRIERLYEAIGLGRWFGKTDITNSVQYLAKSRKDKIEPHDDDDAADDYSSATDDYYFDETNANQDPKYMHWLKDHPCALRVFQGIMNAANGKQIVVFLDYDGTLTPIVDDPDSAFMSDAMRSAVRELARKFPTAIISGRSRKKVYEFVKLDELYYAGSHGMDIVGPPMKSKSYECKYQAKTSYHKEKELTIFQPAKEFLPAIEEILNKLNKQTRDIKGVFIENNRFCISVHYRHVLENDYVKLEQKVVRVLAEYPGFHLTRGKKVLEIRPSIEWNKGNAVVYLLDTLGFANSSNVFPIFIGDDKTDEDAFKVLRSSKQGCGILVSSTSRETWASSSLRDPSQVLSFLIRLARWGPPMAAMGSHQ